MKNVFENGDIAIIAGGGGFLGRSVTKHILNELPDSKVIILDNWICSNKEEALEDLQDYLQDIEIFDCDVRDFVDIYQNLKKSKFLKSRCVRAVLNFASIPTPRNYTEKPFVTFETNIVGTENLLNLFQSYIKAIFIQASTSEIYGKVCDNGIALQMCEDSGLSELNTTDLRACYAESKRAAETCCGMHSRHHRELDYWILRIFNVYGPGMSATDGRVIPNFVQRMVNDETCEVNGYRSRCFMYITDFSNVVMDILRGRYHRTAIPKDQNLMVMNVGSDNSVPVLTVYKMVRDIVQKARPHGKFDVQFGEDQTTEDDPRVRIPDLSKWNRIKLPVRNHEKDFQSGLEMTVQRLLEKNYKLLNIH